MNEKQIKLLERNITHEQRVRISLWDINRNIRYGVGLIAGFILVLICSITKSLLFIIISTIGIWAIFITLIIAINRDKNFIEEFLDYYETKKNILETKKQ